MKIATGFVLGLFAALMFGLTLSEKLSEDDPVLSTALWRYMRGK